MTASFPTRPWKLWRATSSFFYTRRRSSSYLYSLTWVIFMLTVYLV